MHQVEIDSNVLLIDINDYFLSNVTECIENKIYFVNVYFSWQCNSPVIITTMSYRANINFGKYKLSDNLYTYSW